MDHLWRAEDEVIIGQYTRALRTVHPIFVCMSGCYAPMRPEKLPDCGFFTTKAWRIRNFGELAWRRISKKSRTAEGTGCSAYATGLWQRSATRSEPRISVREQLADR